MPRRALSDGRHHRRKAAVAIDHGRCVHCFRCQSGSGRAQASLGREDYEWAAYAGETATARRRLDASIRSLAAHSLCRRRRLRRLHERGAATQQSLLQHASPRLLHHADAAQCRCAAGRGPGLGRDAASLCARPMTRCRRRSGSWRSAPAPSPAACSGRASARRAGSARSSRSMSSVPGCPPPPLAILHGLLVLVGRKPPTARESRDHDSIETTTMNNVAPLFAAFFILCGCGAVASFLTPARWRPAALAAIGSAAALLLLLISGMILFGDARLRVDLWEVVSLGTLKLGADRLSALFLFVCGAGLLPGLAVLSRLSREARPYSLPYFGVLYHGLFASIVLILIADDALSFLIAWEAMSILSYLLVTFEYEQRRELAGRLRHAGDERGAAPSQSPSRSFSLERSPAELDFATHCDRPRSLSARMSGGRCSCCRSSALPSRRGSCRSTVGCRLPIRSRRPMCPPCCRR